MAYIRITSIPTGEAPAEIRAAWIGTVLPIADGAKTPKRLAVTGVMTGPRTWSQMIWQMATAKYRSEYMDGFYVEGIRAIQILEKQNGQAAIWWCQNLPHVIRPGFTLVFPAECCEVMTDSST